MGDGGDKDRSKSGSGYPENQTALSFSDILFRDREHQTAQSPYGVVSFLDGTGGSRSYSPSIRNYQGLEIEASRDGRGTFRCAKEFWCRNAAQSDYR